MKILFLTANPDRTERLRVDAEYREIRERIRQIRSSDALEVVHVGAVRPDDLHSALDEAQPDIVHFSGHGIEGGDLFLETDDGRIQRTPKEAIAEMFRIRRHNVRLVVLNACHSQPLAERIAEHVGAAIGMARRVWDHAAIDFSAELYRNLGDGKSIREAFACAQNVLRLKSADEDADALRLEIRQGSGADALVLAAARPKVVLPAIEPSTRPEIALILDLASNNPVVPEEIFAQLPPTRRERRLLLASQFGALSSPHGPGTDFHSAAAAITRMVSEARAGIPEGHAARFFVGGRAPLPLYAHLGMELSLWADDITLVNRRDGDTWDVLPLQGVAPPPGDFFEIRRGLGDGAPPSEASGRLAVFVSTCYTLDAAEIRGFLERQGARIADIVELRAAAKGEKWLAANNAAQAMQELVSLFKDIKVRYPHREGVALFIAGPTTLAFMAGRAFNRHILKGDVWVPNFHNGVYSEAVRLPFRETVRPAVSDAPADDLERRQILEALRDRITLLRRSLRREHLIPALDCAAADALLARLSTLEIAREPQGEAFDLRASERSVAFGRDLLEVLRSLDEPCRLRIGSCLILHELLHVDQNLPSGLHHGVGRAGVALEEVDYRADTLAVGALTAWEINRAGEEGRERAGAIVTAYVDAVIFGMEAFDTFAQGGRIERLAERRLRRYLTWHLQRVRAMTVFRPEEIPALLGERLIVELAPLRGRLDDRHDKIIEAPLPQTELFVALGGRLLWTAPRPGLEPRQLAEAVSAFDHDALETAMKVVREQHRSVLTPWVP